MKTKKLISVVLTLILIFSAIGVQSVQAEEKIKVLLVGDSLTAGLIETGTTYTKEECYGDFLSDILGDEYEVKALGIPAYGLYSEHKYSYTKTDEYKNALDYKADIVVSFFGTNDAKTDYWSNIKDSYSKIYADFLEAFKKGGADKIIAVIPTPVFGDGDYAKDRPAENMSEMRGAVKRAASSQRAEVVDLYTPFEKSEALFPDGLHWNREGAEKGAKLIGSSVLKCADEIKNAANLTDKEIKAMEIMNAFGITDNLNPEDKMSRGMFVTSLVNILGIEGTLGLDKVAFSDVDAESELSSAVSVAYGLGLISGFGDGTFRPDESLKYEQAVKMLVSLMGYDVYAAAKGGWPSGYMQTAATLGILKGISLSGGEEIKALDAAVMIYNALEVPLLQNVKFPEGEYRAVEGDTILSKWLKYKKVEGVLDATNITSLSEEKGVNDGYISIDDVLYFAGDKNFNNFFGYKVEAYAEEINGVDTIIYLTASGKSETAIIDKDDIEIITLESVQLFADENGRRERHTFSDNLSVIYNGKYMAKDKAAAYLMPKDGRIILLDRENDGKTDVLFIENSFSVFVSDVSVTHHIIYDKYSETTVSYDENDTVCIIEKNGEIIDISQIERNNVLTVFESVGKEGKKYLNIKVGTENFSGAVTEFSEDSVCIDGYEYKWTDGAEYEISKLSVGDKSMFYFSHDGKIGGLGKVVPDSVQYGYLTNGGLIKKGIGSEGVATFQLFSLSERKLVEFETASKVSYNGSFTDSYGTPYDGAYILDMFSDGESFEHQLIQYTLDKSFKIRDITKYVDATKNGIGYDEDNFSLDYTYTSSKPTATSESYYRYYKDLKGGMIQNRFYTASAIFLKVPADDADGNIDPELISVFNPATSWDNDYRIRNIQIYDVNKKGEASVIIEKGTLSKAPTTVHFVVDKVTVSETDDGYPTRKIYGYYGNTYSGYFVSPDADFDPSAIDVKRGDVIRVALDGKKEITYYQKLFTIRDAEGFLIYGDKYDDFYGTVGSENYTKTGLLMWNREYKVSHVRCVGKEDGAIRVTLGKDNFRNIILPLGVSETIVYDEKTDKLYKGTVDDILPGNTKQTLLVSIRYANSAHIYVINRAESIEPTSNIDYTTY